MTPSQVPKRPFPLLRALCVYAVQFGTIVLAAVPSAQATITLTADPALTSGSNYIRRLTMRMGSNLIGSITNVTFNVTGANLSPTPAPVTGVPDAGAAPASSPVNSVRISVSNRWTNFAGQRVIVSVNTAASMSCISGPCLGSGASIPFSTISWTAFNLAGAPYAGQDFVSGSFTGSASQTLLDFTAPTSNSFNITNDWVFSYNNSVLYPAGSYRGRATFTAFMP